MGTAYTGNRVHDTTVNNLEGIRQGAVSASMSRAAVISAELMFYRGALASALSNGVNPVPYLEALAEFGHPGGV